MTSTPTRRARKTRSSVWAPLCLALIPLWLTGCCKDEPPVNPSWEIYAPESLVLKAGVPVQTAEGVYLPKQDELWHSNRKVRELRELALDATRALEAARNNQSNVR